MRGRARHMRWSMPEARRWSRATLGVLFALGWGTTSTLADEPLHARIDRAIESRLSGSAPRAALATDGEFLRRVTLDLTGMIPTAGEARAFLDDPSPYKRYRQIDRLLGSPEYARWMQAVFDVMLMERRPDVNVAAPAWQAFLRDAFLEDMPYNVLVRQILEADGLDPERRGPAKFYLDRGGELDVLTR